MSLLRRVLRPQLIVLAAALAVVLVVHNSVYAGWNCDEESDSDGVPCDADNCVFVPNASQADTDLDGYGNACDADYDNTGVVGTTDFSTFKQAWNTSAPTYNEQVDHDCTGVVGTTDFSTFKQLWNQASGPTDLACAGTVPCPATAHGCP